MNLNGGISDIIFSMIVKEGLYWTSLLHRNS